MTALKPRRDKKSSSRKMVGSFLSQPTSEKLHLYAFAYEKSVSEVIDAAAAEWCKNHTPAEETMVGLITSRTRAEYNSLNQEDRETYTEELSTKLQSKLISPPIVTLILTATADGAK